MRINIVQLGTLLLTDVYGEFRRWSARLPGHLLRRVISRADCQLRFAHVNGSSGEEMHWVGAGACCSQYR
jgi:hypothetical protein